MYGQQESVSVIQQPDRPPVLKKFADELSGQIDRSFSAINRIENKLHEILNLRKPEAKSDGTQPAIGDFASFSELKLNQIYTLNNRLDDIENHLIKING